MARNTENSKVTPVELSMTPMIDVTFLLLIFFMLACKFKTVEGYLKAYLPKEQGPHGTDSVYDTGTLRVGLRWADYATGRSYQERTVGQTFEEYYEQVKRGYVVLAVRQRTYEEVAPGWPDYEALYRDIVFCKSEYKAPPTRPDKEMPLIIDAREAVPWKHVVMVLNAAVRAGVKEITFAVPEKVY